ncbi:MULTISPECIES: hypothetical protein [Acinetobacter]|uniref:Cystatin domain-containing protein n=1 Tax=Acinetobacter corruptisaponis TaxID=3045147 RepID=A0ABY8S3I2_9GAMM|nr:hypothetical protein [Acinetobacter sp. KCTC 92772]WHP04769.1 hypothetical protein QLH32_11965 [Acinetobacter sp. KCTC 92772]
MRLSVVGMLAVAMTVLVKDEAVKCRSIELSDVSTDELFAARSKAKEGEYLALYDFVVKVQLIDSKGNKYPVTYEMLRDTSSANYKKLEELDYQLLAKLSAESLENPSS